MAARSSQAGNKLRSASSLEQLGGGLSNKDKQPDIIEVHWRLEGLAESRNSNLESFKHIEVIKHRQHCQSELRSLGHPNVEQTVSDPVRFEQITKPQMPYASVRLQLEPPIDSEYPKMDEQEREANLRALARRRSERSVRIMNLQQPGRHSVWKFESGGRA